jgi:hypothetical protein
LVEKLVVKNDNADNANKEENKPKLYPEYFSEFGLANARLLGGTDLDFWLIE